MRAQDIRNTFGYLVQEN